MNKFVLSCLLTALLLIAPSAVFISQKTENLEGERRQIASFPNFPTKLRSSLIKRYFREIDNFFADHFPLRTHFLRLSTYLHEASGNDLNIDKCYRGKENWLFLGNSYARTVDKLRGSVILSGNNLKSQAENYVKIRNAAENSGAEFFMFIGPNKSSIYPEYLPTIVSPAQQRFIAPLLDALNEAGVKVYDPTARLIDKKAEGLLYYRTDTHWNARGAYEAFEGFRKLVALPKLPSFSFGEAPAYGGDLVSIGGYEKFPLSVGDNFSLHWNPPFSLHKRDGLTTNARAASGKTVWVFGDSFSLALAPYLTASFKKIRFFKHTDFDAAMLSQFSKPNIILWVIVERNLANPG